jgi:hypothetical protein
LPVSTDGSFHTMLSISTDSIPGDVAMGTNGIDKSCMAPVPCSPCYVAPPSDEDTPEKPEGIDVVDDDPVIEGNDSRSDQFPFSCCLGVCAKFIAIADLLCRAVVKHMLQAIGWLS